MEQLLDRYGDAQVLLGAGALIGIVFGSAAYTSRFCLRAATAEVAGGVLGGKLAIWLVAFLTALLSVQTALYLQLIDVSTARQLAATGSMSGAIIGGLMFGSGMILARGCASRLLVLSASGNLRAIITGLVLTLTAQAALRGVLAPARETLAGLWLVQGGADRTLVSVHSAATPIVLVAALGLLIWAARMGKQRSVPTARLVAAGLVGLCVFAGWAVTSAIAAASFDIVAVQSITFTGPSADTLMGLVNARDLPAGFGLGLVPGVFIGALIAAALSGGARIQRFDADTPMERYLIGGVMMGFGSMLAGGCAVGAGLSGGAILALTAWCAVFCMWVGAVATQLVLTGRPTLRSAPR